MYTIDTNHAKALSKLASTDDARPVLQGIHITPKYIESTDGYVMGWVQGEYSEEELIPVDSLKPLLSTTTSIIIEADGIINNIPKNSKTAPVIQYAPLKGQYPDTQKLLKAQADFSAGVRVKITLNAKLLKRVCDAMLDVTQDSAHVINLYIPTNPLKPVLITGGELKILLMPVKERKG